MEEVKEACNNFFISKSRTLAAFCLCFLLGVAAATAVQSSAAVQSLFLWVMVGLAVFFFVFFRSSGARFTLGCIFAFALGLSRYGAAFPKNESAGIQTYAGQRVALTGYITAEPDVRLDEVRYFLSVKQAESSQSENAGSKFASVAAVSGRVYFKTDLYPRYQYGDRMKVECALKRPEPIVDKTTGEVFAYDKYLARFGVFAVCQYPTVHKVGEGGGNYFKFRLLRFKNRLAERVNALWPEPHASFMAGLLYGYRGGLGDLQEMFSVTGVTHIVAISGYNITIIATILIAICTYLYIPRPKAFWLVVGGITLFVIFTGASSSVVRAGVMGIITLLARQLGRPSRVGNVLLLAAVIMNLHNPLVLRYDAGFQLSFLSTLGLVYLAPILGRKAKFIPETMGLRETFVSTVSAIIATLPLILYQFGRLSIVAPLVNILILWLIPWLMLFGFLALTASFIWWPLAQVLAGFAWLGLEYIIKVVTWFAHLPGAAVNMRMPFWAVLAAYCGMIYLVKRKRIVNYEF